MVFQLKDALKAWEEKKDEKRKQKIEKGLLPASTERIRAAEAEKIMLNGWYPAIEKMDSAAVANLKNCKRLALSTNSIDRIGSLQGLSSIEILSFSRNLIKKLENLDGVAATLTQLWISYNYIASLAGIEKLKKLKVLYVGNNKIASWTEIDRLKELVELEDLLLIGNPLEKNSKDSGENYRLQVLIRLPHLKKLDGRPFDINEREQAETLKKDMD
ncbi:hypothetical protein ABK040_015173 [Willaertia magna]